MPTFASQQVAVVSQTLKTSLTLDEIVAQLSARAPKPSSRGPGWRAITDDLPRAIPNGDPGAAGPQFWPADPDENFPDRVAARYVWWVQRALDAGGIPEDTDPWYLDGIDVLISPSAGAYHLLWSSHDSALVTAPGGTRRVGEAVNALLLALDGADPKVDVSSASVLSFDRDVYLWLTHVLDAGESLAGGIKIAEVAGMSTDEIGGSRRNRSSVLSGEIDMERVSFISAIATGVHLGPAAITFRELNKDGKAELTCARLFTDGAFKPLLSGCHYRDVLSKFEERLRAVQRTAYRYIPLVQAGFAADKEWLDEHRDRLLVEKQIFLSQEFRRLAEANPQFAAWVAEYGEP